MTPSSTLIDTARQAADAAFDRHVGRAGLSFAARLTPSAAARYVVGRFLRPPRTRAARPEEVAFAAEVRRVELGDDLYVAEVGSGAPVLLVHGWGSRSTRLYAVARAVADSGRRAVLVDLPAHGRSAGRTLTPAAAASALLRVAAVIGPLEAVVGHSFGGAAAALALARGLPAARIAMIGSPSSYARVFERVLDQVGLEGPARARATTELERRLDAPLASIDVGAVAPRVADRPLLVAHDPDDAEVPFEDALRNMRVWPRAELLRVEGAGHRGILERPELHEALAGFLERSTRSPGLGDPR